MGTAERSETIDRVLTLRDFWRGRNLESHLLIERLTANNLSIGLAFAGYRLGMAANMLSVGSGVIGIVALLTAIVLPVEMPAVSVVTIFALSQFALLLDCVDGQLARVTGTASEYGAFLDKAIDFISMPFQYAAVFVYAYRYYTGIGMTPVAEAVLLFGFIFILGTLARFFTWQIFYSAFPEKYEYTKIKDNYVTILIKNCMDHQVSIFNILIALISPITCLLVFFLQLLLRAAAYIRYLRRVRSG